VRFRGWSGPGSTGPVRSNLKYVTAASAGRSNSTLLSVLLNSVKIMVFSDIVTSAAGMIEDNIIIIKKLRANKQIILRIIITET
jgi:hypothetical protein